MDSLLNKPKRIESVDILRGLVMIIMALDHTRDFTHAKAWTENPLGMDTTTPLLFFTRWITHFCAPIFVFLSGASAYLQSLRKSKKELSAFLIKRGIWLVVVDLIVMSFCFSFNTNFNLFIMQVIWVTGIGMIILGLTNRLPLAVLFTAGLLIVLGHNLLDFYEKTHTGAYPFWYELLHRQNLITISGKYQLFIFYPLLPWVGLMLLGYCFGRMLTAYEGIKRRKILITTGTGIILFFILLRWANFYGDPFPWSTQKSGVFTFLSFINVTKYPPSLLFMSMTIGPGIIFLALVDTAKNRVTRIISVYGRVPFFYYILHFYLLHVLCAVLFFTRGHSFAQSKPANNFLPHFVIPGEGYPLWMVYLFWIAVVVSLYPLCKWYDRYKSAHREKWWLGYL